MERCVGCERRRVEMRLMTEAAAEWIKNPTGPNVGIIHARLRAEAVAKGELDDGTIRPNS